MPAAQNKEAMWPDGTLLAFLPFPEMKFHAERNGGTQNLISVFIFRWAFAKKSDVLRGSL